jgi:hypothetical protein
MDAILTAKAEQLAGEMATQARTLEDLNGLIRSMMKSALERMLNTELDVHLGRRTVPGSVRQAAHIFSGLPRAVASRGSPRRPGSGARPAVVRFTQAAHV